MLLLFGSDTREKGDVFLDDVGECVVDVLGRLVSLKFLEQRVTCKRVIILGIR